MRPPTPDARIRRPAALLVPLAALALLLAPPPAALAASLADPAGDTFGVLEVQHDLLSLAAENDGASLLVELVFAGEVTPADGGAATALGGYLDVDADQNVTTGTAGTVDAFTRFASGLGVSHYVDLGGYSAATGDAPVLDAVAGTIAGRAALRFRERSVLVTIPLAALGGDDGFVALAAVVGTPAEATDAAPHGGSLTSDDTAARLAGQRFRVEVAWGDFQGGSGAGHLVPGRSDDSALFWFFDPANWEVLVKVLDACPLNQHFWVFAAATTNVEYTLTVTDTATGATFAVHNPLGRSSPATTATDAFATCP